MKQKFVNNKYQFYADYNRPDIDYSELVTVPDQVLSMYDIYMKYAVRGDITGLANNIRPHVTDDLDLDDPELNVDYDDDVDVLQRIRTLKSLRNEVSDPAYPAAEDIPVAEGVDKEPQAPAKPEKPASDNAGSAGSE